MTAPFPTIISYYTKQTGYEREVQNLIASCKKWDLPYCVEPIASLGTWEENCCYKPKFILKKLEELKTPVLWLDADAVVAKKPTLFQSLSVDLAVRIVDSLPEKSPSKVISGTLYVNQTPAAKRLIRTWDRECQRLIQKRVHPVWDQIALRNALPKEKATVYPLPRMYYMIYDTMTTQSCRDQAIIIHHQASRIFQKEINQTVVPFWSACDSSQEQRVAFSKKITKPAN